jgi:hypothetical protein
VYVDLLPPCNAACPAGENIQGWLAHAQDGEYERAWRAPVQDNPFAAIHGRVCYHPCESSCNRLNLDSASALLQRGPEYASMLLDGLRSWMERKGFEAVDEFRGLLAVPAETDQAAYERAGYVSALRAANARAHGPWS